MFSGLLLSAALLAPAADPAPRDAVVPAQAVELPQVPDAAPQAPPAADTAPADAGASKVSLKDVHEGPPYSAWGEADYLIFWLKPGPNPVPLLATPGGILLGTDKI